MMLKIKCWNMNINFILYYDEYVSIISFEFLCKHNKYSIPVSVFTAFLILNATYFTINQ
jgi:hypothetical protein